MCLLPLLLPLPPPATARLRRQQHRVLGGACPGRLSACQHHAGGARAGRSAPQPSGDEGRGGGFGLESRNVFLILNQIFAEAKGNPFCPVLCCAITVGGSFTWVYPGETLSPSLSAFPLAAGSFFCRENHPRKWTKMVKRKLESRLWNVCVGLQMVAKSRRLAYAGLIDAQRQNTRNWAEFGFMRN